MKIGVLANENSWYWNDLKRAALARGHSIARADFELLSACSGRLTNPLRTPDSNAKTQPNSSEIVWSSDAIIVRTMPPGTLEQVVFRMDLLSTLIQSGVEVVNSPRAMECAVDKYLTTACLERAGLAVPRTITCQDSETAMVAFGELGGDVVVKPLFGSEGRGIVRVSDQDLAFRTFRTIERTGCVLYLQQFVEHPGYDIRVLVLNGAIIGSMKRFSVDDFRTNVSRKARAAAHNTTDAEQELALQAAKAIDCRIAGVDLLYDKSGACYVIEVNAVPGWKAFNRVNKTDVAGLLVDALEARRSDS